MWLIFKRIGLVWAVLIFARPEHKMKVEFICRALGACAMAAASLGSMAASERVPQSGDRACLSATPAAVSCDEPGLYARASDMAALAASPSPKAEAARRELAALYAKGSCSSNQSVSAAAGGHVYVLRRAHRARSKSDDAISRQLEDEALAAENVASYKAPPKFKGAELYTGSSQLRVCK